MTKSSPFIIRFHRSGIRVETGLCQSLRRLLSRSTRLLYNKGSIFLETYHTFSGFKIFS